MRHFYVAIKSIFAVVLVLIAEGFSTNVNAATYTVLNTNDAGTGSLRQAILNANANAGADVINFNIPGVGVKTITLLSAMQQITGPTTINGYSQPGAAQGPIGSRTILIGINGGVGTYGVLTFTTGSTGSSVSGLSIYNTISSSPAIGVISTASNTTSNIHIWGNYIGVLPNGTMAPANTNDAVSIAGAAGLSGTITNVTVGTNGDATNDANEGNVLSNSVNPSLGGDGIQIGHATSNTTSISNIRISGNYIGLLADGVTAAPNGLSNAAAIESFGADGVLIVGASNVLIGSNADGVSDAFERNIISGNTAHGIELNSGRQSTNINIAGNYIGTDKTGLVSVANGYKAPGGGVFSGIQVTGTSLVSGGHSNVIIGFNDATMLAANAVAARNVISGNKLHGIQFFNNSNSGNKISGNYVGVNATGNVALGNGQVNSNNAVAATTAIGIDIISSANILVGTDADADDDVLERNVVSGNISSRGIFIRSTSTGNIVTGNYIGVGADGTTAIGNGFSGIHIDASNNNRIGSNDDNVNDAVEANIIANNANSLNTVTTTSDGVRITLNSISNRISRNIFYNNKSTPIDLANDVVSVNDGTTSAGQPNLLLDYPVFTSYTFSGTTMTVNGYVGQCNGTETVAGTTIVGTTTVQVYKVADDGDQYAAISNNGCSRSLAHGEGVQYLGSITVTNGVFTNATFTLVAGASFNAGDKLTGITIDAAGNTSEFGVDVNASAVGYIYVHKKSLNEINKDFSFSVTGGTTAVPTFTLNDEPTQISAFFDIGAAENGRLWAATNGGVLYYRDVNSTIWVNTGIAGVARVDGGPLGTCYYINSAGTAFSYDGVVAPVQISSTAKFNSGGGWQDIGSGWTGTPTSSVVDGNGTAVYAVNNDGNVYKWNGPGTTTWGTYTTIGGTQYRVDVNPNNGNVVVGRDNGGSIRTILEITTAATPVVTSLGSPVPNFAAYKDIAVNQNGEIFAVATDINAPQGAYVFKFVSGTTWSKELGSFDAIKITGGINNTLWTTQNSGGWGGGSGWNGVAGPYPFYNIFTRALDGTTPIYIDDERVRTTTGNSELIPVVPGTYTITEAIAAGWDLQKILIYDPTTNSTSNQVAGTTTINVSAGEVVNVVYQNGELNAFPMTSDCGSAYVETFGSGTLDALTSTGRSFGLPVAGQTSYHYLADKAPGEDGYYKIVSRANPDFNGWGGATGIIDHTPDANVVGSGSNQGGGAYGYMYAVNAGFDKGEFFRRRFTGVVPGATYNFSAWVVDLTASAAVNPNLSFTVYDHTTQAVLASYNTGELTSTTEPDAWEQYGFSFTATSTDIDLVIGNNGFGGNGNDLAIDDISFTLLAGAVPITTVANTGCGTLGSITVTSPLGASYEYSKDGFATAGQLSPVFSGLAPGTYTISTRFIGSTNCTTSKVDFIGTAICGNIWDDVNGNAINGSESPITAGVWVNLVDPVTHDVIQSVQVDASGNYSFTGLPQNTSYQIILSTTDQTGNLNLITSTLPSGYVATGTNLSGVASTTNTTGIISVNTGANGLTNQNFGIEEPPITVDDSGTGTVGSPVTLNILTNDSDPSGTPLNTDSLSLILPVGATNPVYDAQGDLIGFTVPGEGVWSYNNTTGGLTFTPAIGFTGNPTPITYTVTDLAGQISNISTVTITYPSSNITGTVFNDVNGTGTLNPGETGTTGGTNLYVYLVNSAGIVVDSAKVNTDGTYSLGGIPNTTYTIELSTTQYAIGTNTATTPIVNTPPAGWVTTGEGAANTNDLTPNGTLTVTSGSDGTTVSNNNFGIEQPPVAVNNTGTGTVSNPVTINILTNDSDPSGTPLNTDSLTLILPVGATNPVYDAQGDLIGFVVPGEGTWSYNNTTGEVTFTPAPGYTGNPTPITYTVTDLAGVSSNVATITITYPSSNITGTVFDDANGSGTLNVGETGTTAGSNLYVYLINSGGIVIDSAKVKEDGTYTLGGTPNTAYTIELSTTQYAIGTNTTSTPIVNTPPTGWVTTGEGAANTNDGTPNGTLSVTSGALNTTTTDNNFGIEQLPDSYPRTQFVPYPTGGIIPLGTATTAVSGYDPEDGNLDNDNKFVVTKLPTNATMLYNGIAVTVGQEITNFNPALLSFTNITNGSIDVVFEYAFIDAAGKQDPTPAKYTLSWAQTAPLPITLESFTGVAKDCNTVNLNWKVSDAINFSHFEIERSTNGVNYKTVGVVFYDAAIASYQFSENVLDKGSYQYRLKLIDVDGKNKYSPVSFIRLDCNQQRTLLVFPNPAKDKVTLSGLKGGEQVAIYNAAGQLMYTRKATEYQLNIDITKFTNGIYYIIITNKDGVKVSESKITKIN